MYTNAQREHYLNNKSDYKTRTQERRAERRIWFDEVVKVGKFCKTCGEKDPACLDFHHRDPNTKVATVNKLLTSLRSKEKILEEIEKCDVLCANCHRKHHRYQGVER